MRCRFKIGVSFHFFEAAKLQLFVETSKYLSLKSDSLRPFGIVFGKAGTGVHHLRLSILLDRTAEE